jgi:hypothetical protein
MGYKIFNPQETLPDSISTIVLSSYVLNDKLKEEARIIYKNKEIIDVYQYWEQQGYHFTKDFWFGTKADRDVGFPNE